MEGATDVAVLRVGRNSRVARDELQQARSQLQRVRSGARRKYRAQRTPLPHRPALARSDRNNRLAVSSLIHNLDLEHRNKPRFQLFFRCKEKPNFAKNQVVIARDKAEQTQRRQSWSILAAALFLLSIGSAAHRSPRPPSTPAPTGEWLVADRVARIKIVDCSGHLWGVVAWEARPGGTDIRNPDPQLRSRPTLGMPILLDMTSRSRTGGRGGSTIRKTVKTYSATSACLIRTRCASRAACSASCAEARTGLVLRQATPSAARRRQHSQNRRQAAARRRRRSLRRLTTLCSRVLGAAGLPHERGLK